ncbi:MAG: ribosome silencing factor [Cystobacterineae bacterium]|nr:ribosome silencing factor [Cystobacterineae bacterium]
MQQPKKKRAPQKTSGNSKTTTTKTHIASTATKAKTAKPSSSIKAKKNQTASPKASAQKPAAPKNIKTPNALTKTRGTQNTGAKSTRAKSTRAKSTATKNTGTQTRSPQTRKTKNSSQAHLNKKGLDTKSVRAPLKKIPLPRIPRSNPEAVKLAQNMAHLLLQKKATEVVLFDVYEKSSYADVIVVASGSSGLHLSSLSKHLWESLKEQNLRPLSVEGSGNTSWVLMDFGDVVVHLFLPEIRALYDLDGLWSDVPCEHFR